MSERTCVFCQTIFTPHDKRMIYCSKSCAAKAAYRRRLTAGPLPLQAEFKCAHCGEFVPSKPKRGPSPTYCSWKCRGQAQYLRDKAAGGTRKPRRKPAEVFSCADCGQNFESARADARFCSRRCQSAWARKNETGECAEAGCLRPVRAKSLCVNHYRMSRRAAGISEKQVWTDARRDQYHQRRAQKKGTSTGRPVLMAEIAERDGWTCGLCSEPVDADLVWPAPLSRSLDHVVPLSRGGVHDPSNVQLAHLRCNTAKGNRAA